MKYFSFLAIFVLSVPGLLHAQRKITVVGEGIAKAKPDYAVVSLSIRSKNATSSSALATSNEDFTHLTTLLANAGVSSTDVEQRDFKIYHNDYDYSSYRTMTPAPASAPAIKKKGSKKSSAKDVVVTDSTMTPASETDADPAPEPVVHNPYELTANYTVKVHNLQSLPTVLDACEQAGSTNPGIEHYDVFDHQKLKMLAEENAMNDAREKAGRLAKDMGGAVGDIISIDDPIGESGLSGIIKLIQEETHHYGNVSMQEVSESVMIKVTFSVK
jgi:uncharacterized protein YggE